MKFTQILSVIALLSTAIAMPATNPTVGNFTSGKDIKETFDEHFKNMVPLNQLGLTPADKAFILNIPAATWDTIAVAYNKCLTSAGREASTQKQDCDALNSLWKANHLGRAPVGEPQTARTGAGLKEDMLIELESAKKLTPEIKNMPLASWDKIAADNNNCWKAILEDSKERSACLKMQAALTALIEGKVPQI
ncbi:hypothetical protein ABW20_dc0102924 [Dactylellina cionopaga]|nr:hypothetical protein ABW20_dc0102924 [Dactylellina cionopaga]